MSMTKVPAGMLIRLRAGETPRHPAEGQGHHAARSTVDYDQGIGTRDPGDYMGRHRTGSLIVVPFHNAPAQLVATYEAVSA